MITKELKNKKLIIVITSVVVVLLLLVILFFSLFNINHCKWKRKRNNRIW